MLIKKIGARTTFDSRNEKTIEVIVWSDKGKFITSSPAGKSKGSYEVINYKESLEHDIKFINNFDKEKINKIIKKNSGNLNFEIFFNLLKEAEALLINKIGGNSLFALESSLLKAAAYDNNKELWDYMTNLNKKNIEFPRPVGNVIGGGIHSKGRNGKKPDFQEFLFIPNCKTFKENFKLNRIAYKLVWKKLGYWIKKRNDEGAWETDLSNEQVLELLNEVKKIIKTRFGLRIEIGIDCASSFFFKNKFYVYKNPPKKLDSTGQRDYLEYIIKNYDLFYIEDPFNEKDFESFAKLKQKTKNCLIVGDDLTVTNPKRLKKAIKKNSINAIIIKPNQIGSLLKLKKVIEIAKKHNIKTIISHRSGETKDNTISDFAIGFQCDFIKTGIYGKFRESKLKRLLEIEEKINRPNN